MTEEEIKEDFERKRRLLEEDEQTLKIVQHKGDQWIQETLSDVYQIVRKSAVDSEPFDQAKQSIAKLEDKYHEELSRAKKQVYRQQEELEREYRKNLQRESKK